MHIAKRIGGLFLSAVLLWGAPYPFNSAFASGAEQEQKGCSPSLTIYNQQFAVVRQKLPLDLRPGVNHIQVTDITAHLEPDSVILRSLDVGRHLQILEQNYRNDPVSQQLLLSLYEGKAIDFLETDKDGTARTVQGKIIRSGYVPHYTAFQSYGPQYAGQQAAVAQGSEQPVIEVNGKLQFSLPGQPLFPALADDTVLKPTLSWELLTDKPGATSAEFSYVTGGMNWEASYNVIAPPKSNVLELVGWVTLDNQSGKTFRDARLKLMAGDVNKVPPPGSVPMSSAGAISFGMAGRQFVPPVTEKTFDEYHLYTLEHPTTLHDRETKQVEMVRAAGIQSKAVYVYDGFRVDQNYQNWPMESIRQQESYGILSNPKVWVMQEFKNSSENHLGMPLPKGRVRFYRRDDDGRPSGRPQHVPRSLIEPLRPAPADDEGVLSADVADPHDQYERLHAEDESSRILTYLADPLDRMIMVLRAIEGMKWDDIAILCKRTERTVRLRYERARGYLRDRILKEQAAYVRSAQQL